MSEPEKVHTQLPDSTIRFDEQIKRGEIGGAIELWSSPEGLSPDHVIFTLDRNNPITGDMQLDAWIADKERRACYAAAAAKTVTDRGKIDFNAPKVTVHKIEERGGSLYISGRLSNYFVLWGLDKAALSLSVYRQGVRDLADRRETDVPFGNSTHNMLMVADSRTGEPLLVVMAVDPKHGFAANKLTPTFEHQHHPDYQRPVDAVVAGFKKELGLTVTEANIRLHGIAVETRSAYVCTVHIADMSTQITEKDVMDAWHQTPSWQQGKTLLFVPVNQLDHWKTERIPSSVWSSARMDSHYASLDSGTDFLLHHTGPYRIAVLQAYMRSTV